MRFFASHTKMNIPSSTYRLQVNSTFRFADLERIIPYLEKLGITTIYSAPIFKARPGSVHGYDISDPHVINPEIGSEEEFRRIVQQLKEKKMTWLQDIVPNHMAFDSSNPWLMDVFEKGKHSFYYDFFDIDWDYHDDVYVLDEEKGLKGKVMAPFLGAEPEELIGKGEIQLSYGERGFYIKYHTLEYPLSLPSYCDVLSYGKRFYEIKKDKHRGPYSEYLKLLKIANFIRDQFDQNFDAESGKAFKGMLYQQYQAGSELKLIIDHCLSTINSNPSSLEIILNQQFYKLVHWKTSEKKINYRRFFTINDLICLKIEDKKVFDHYHKYIKELLNKGWIQGLRLDHIDGLNDPSEYVERLRQLTGEETYIVVEKILESEEELQDYWPLQGTSGYEFLSVVNRLFTEDQNQTRFQDLYHDFLGRSLNYNDLIFEKKLFILKEKMGGELNNLLKLLLEISNEPLPSNLKDALAVFLSSFDVYRVYPSQIPLNDKDLEIVGKTFESAVSRFPSLSEPLSFIRNIFIDEQEEKALTFVKRTQQFTGPLAAKGVEDTAFYIYNRLISHNEVGDSPRLFGTSVKEFHQRMRARFTKVPFSINATATHDTKRGEDARMRINVLSELADEWSSAVFTFKDINIKHKKDVNNVASPDSNDEYFIYQALLGGFPVNAHPDQGFIQRLKEYMVKVVREAKVHTDWSQPNEEYENAVVAFIQNILNDNEFLDVFKSLFEKAKNYGIIYSLSQCLLKCTAPGIPDTYQGTELWDFSFVDPDNRRVVDYKLREDYLNQLSEPEVELIHNLVSSKEDGKIKLYTLYQVLNTRRSLQQLFKYGEYKNLEARGSRAQHVIAFARKWHKQLAIVIVPKNIVSISTEEQFGRGTEVWQDTAVILPVHSPVSFKNVLTKKKLSAKKLREAVSHHEKEISIEIQESFNIEQSLEEAEIYMSEVLEDLPVALLVSEE
jgi:(1->4)-alpha-D-glucan 1-alpha-D-glucosylmutase